MEANIQKEEYKRRHPIRYLIHKKACDWIFDNLTLKYNVGDDKDIGGIIDIVIKRGSDGVIRPQYHYWPRYAYFPRDYDYWFELRGIEDYKKDKKNSSKTEKL